MSSKAWFPLYVGDILADTMDFEADEFGAYMFLLLHYWSKQGPITSKPSDLRKICRLSPHRFTKISSKILQKFILKNGKYLHNRMDREIAKAVEISNKRAEAGRAGGVANAQASAKQLPTQPQPHKDTTTRGARLAEGWLPDPELFKWAVKERPDLDITKTVESFRDYWHSVSGAKGVRIKWELVFRNWVRNQRNGTSGQKGNGTRKQTLSERHAAARESAVNDYIAATCIGGEVVGSDG